eukprot:1160849-Pelagomonas_calceolata.AAC.8
MSRHLVQFRIDMYDRNTRVGMQESEFSMHDWLRDRLFRLKQHVQEEQFLQILEGTCQPSLELYIQDPELRSYCLVWVSDGEGRRRQVGQGGV